MEDIEEAEPPDTLAAASQENPLQVSELSAPHEASVSLTCRSQPEGQGLCILDIPLLSVFALHHCVRVTNIHGMTYIRLGYHKGWAVFQPGVCLSLCS